MTSLLDSVGVRTGALCLAFALSTSVLACSDDGTDVGDDTETAGDGDPGDGDGDPGELSFAADIQPIISANCVACHVENGTASFLILTHANLVDQPATVMGLTLVTPGDSSASYLVNKLRGTQLDVGGAGNPMPPPPGASLSEEQITTIEDWIDGGALP